MVDFAKHDDFFLVQYAEIKYVGSMLHIHGWFVGNEVG